MSDHHRAVQAMLNGGFLYELHTDQLVGLELEVSRVLAERYLKETRGQGAPGTFFRDERLRFWGLNPEGRAILMGGHATQSCAEQVSPEEIDAGDCADAPRALAVRPVNPGEVWRVDLGRRRDQLALVVDFDRDRKRWRVLRLAEDWCNLFYQGAFSRDRVHYARARDFRSREECDLRACADGEVWGALDREGFVRYVVEQLDGEEVVAPLADAIEDVAPYVEAALACSSCGVPLSGPDRRRGRTICTTCEHGE